MLHNVESDLFEYITRNNDCFHNYLNSFFGNCYLAPMDNQLNQFFPCWGQNNRLGLFVPNRYLIIDIQVSL